MERRPYAQIVRLISETPWVALPGVLVVVRGIVAEHQAGELPDEAELAERFAERRLQVQAARERADGLSGGGIAVLPLYGVITPKADLMQEMSGGTSTEQFTGWLRAAAAEPGIGAIVIDVDSPGGMAQGVPELAAEIRAVRERKPVLAVANTLAASGAYWLASQATELNVSPSAEVGSIGAYAAHEDVSGMLDKAGVNVTLVSAGKYKVEGNPFEPLSEDARASIQAKVDGYYEMFVADVAAGRGVSAREVKAEYGEGRMLLAQAAVKQGMADRVATLEETVARAGRLGQQSRRAQGRAAALAVGDLPGAEMWTVEQVRMLEHTGVAASVLSADRPARLNHEPKEIQMSEALQETTTPEPAVEPSPRAVDPARDELNKTVHDLKEAVLALKDGVGGRENVERLQEELLELRKRLDEREPASGYLPGDEEADARIPIGADVVAVTWERPASYAATMLRKPVEKVAEFREKADNLLLLAAALKTNPRNLKYYSEEYLPALAAIDTQTTGEGKEFVPTILSTDLIPRVELGLLVVNLFRQVDMPSNPFEIPAFGLARTRGGKHAEQTADTGQTGFKKITPGTRKVTLTAQKFAAEVLVSKEEEEDAIIPILGFLRDELTSQLAYDMEDAVINGDAQGAHMDADVTATDDPRKIWDGLRNLVPAAAKTDGSAAVVTAAALRLNRKKMGKYGVNSANLVTIMSIAGYVNLLADTNVLTVDKYGPNATILNGELARVDGIPIVVSQFVRDDLNATGVYDGTTTTKTIAITVNPSGWVVGTRRALTVQTLTELYAEYDQDAITVSMRKAFAPVYPPATEPIVALTYNLNA